MPPRYQIQIAGELDDAMEESLRESFADLEVTTTDGVTFMVGEFDSAALHGLLERIRMSGLDLIDVRRIRGSPRR